MILRNKRGVKFPNCEIIPKDSIMLLVSCSTVVAYYGVETGKMIVNGWYSKTTAQHIRAFLLAYGFTDKITKSQLEDYDNGY